MKTRKLRHIIITILFLAGLASCIESYFSNPDSQLRNLKNSFAQRDTNSVHFFIISDWGFSGSEGQMSVASAMTKTSKLVGLDFILTCGDNFQIAGIQSATDPLWYYNFEQVYSDSALRVPWHPALGNHDHYGNAHAQVEYSAINPRWEMPNEYYTFVQPIDSFTRIRFIVLDTEDLVEKYDAFSDSVITDSISQYVWLRKTLEDNTEKWTIITGHHPVFSASNHHGDTPEIKSLLKPLLDKYHVDFYICGHDHNFEHARDNVQPTDYIVTGTGGYIRSTSQNSRTIFSLSALGFTYISARKDMLKLSFVTTDGKIAYQYEKTKITSTRN